MVEHVQMIGSGFIPFHADGRSVLVSRRSMNKRHFPGLWEILGGNLERGEDFEACVRREVQEEVACGILDLEHLASRARSMDDKLYMTVCWTGHLDGDPVMNTDEIQELRWVQRSDLQGLEFCPGDREMLELAFDRLGRGNKERFLRFIALYAAKNLEEIAPMIHPDVVLRDWNLVVRGKDAFLRETARNFANARSLDIKVLSLMENADTVSGELIIRVNGTEVLWVVDIFTFDAQGLITRSRSFIGIPEESL